MKYYIYISDTKVDMLLPQIPHEAKKKIATELKIDFKVFSASRKTEQEDDNRIKRLEAVSSFILEFGNVGTIDNPDEYVAGTLPMRWGPVDYLWKSEDAPIVYFGGFTENTVIGLGGSGKHILGNTSTGSFHSGSNYPALLYSLARRYELNAKDKSQLLEWKEVLEKVELSLHSRPLTESIVEHLTCDAVYHASKSMNGPQQRLEFLAKRLFWNEVHGEKVLLATPLYVAMVD